MKPTRQWRIWLSSLANQIALKPPESRVPPTGNLPPDLPGGLPIIGHAASIFRDPIAFQQEGHLSVGEVFTANLLGQPLYFVNRGALLTRSLLAASDELSLVDAYRQIFGRVFGENFFNHSPPELLRSISMLSVGKQSRVLAELAPPFVRRQLTGRRRIDMLELCSTLIFYLASNYICGTFISEQERNELHQHFLDIEDYLALARVFLPFNSAVLQKRERMRKRILAILQAALERRLSSEQTEEDCLSTIIERHRDAAGLFGERQREEAAISVMGLIMGAHINTAISLAATLYDLLGQPIRLATVKHEADNILAGRPFQLDALLEMRTMFRCINESIRIRGNGAIFRKALKPVSLGEWIIPQDGILVSMMGLINQRVDVYPDPATYNPERYHNLRTDHFQSPSIHANNLEFGVFGAGRHICPGRSLSYILIGISLVTLLRDYHWALLHKPWGWADMFAPGMGRPLGRFYAEARSIA